MGIFTHPSVEGQEIAEDACSYCGGSGMVPSEDIPGEMEECRVCEGTGKK